MRHGQRKRALAVCEALVEENRRDGIAAAALAELVLEEGDAAKAVETLRFADIPSSLAYAAAVLETRALKQLGKTFEAQERWTRYLESRKGAERRWL